MKSEHSPLRITCLDTPTAGKNVTFAIEFDFTTAVSISALVGRFEGVCRTSISNQTESRTIITVPFDFGPLLYKWRSNSGKIRAAAGHYRADTTVFIHENCPGTFSSKNGSIEYAASVKMRTNGRIGTTEIVRKLPIFMMPSADISRYPQYRVPVNLVKNHRKKVICFYKSNTYVSLRLRKSAFVQGEYISVSGEVINDHPSTTVKGGVVELVKRVKYICKGNTKESDESISYFALGVAEPLATVPFQHAFQVPTLAFPTYSEPGGIIHVSYYIVIEVHDCPKVEVPIFVGTGKPVKSIPSPLLAITAPSTQTSPFKMPKDGLLKHPRVFQPEPPYCLPPLPLGPPASFPIIASHPTPLITHQFPPPYIPYQHFTSSKTNFDRESPNTPYEGQSVLRIEEID